MHISGSGRIPAGEYQEKISVSGSGRLEGNIRCVALSASGSVHATGSLECAEDIRVSGSGHFNGSVTAGSLSASGSAHVGEDLTVRDTVKASGSLSVGGGVKCAVLRCAGSLRVGQGIEAEEFRSAGGLHCEGLVNAEIVDISMDGRAHSQVGSIGGSEIRVYLRKDGKPHKRRLPLFSRLLGGAGAHLTVSELVEGDTVALECVTVPRVVGRVVAIGAGCEVELVQYSEELEVDPDAQVGRSERI